jgi:hypothetical protein
MGGGLLLAMAVSISDLMWILVGSFKFYLSLFIGDISGLMRASSSRIVLFF